MLYRCCPLVVGNDVVLTLVRTGTLQDADFIGTQTYKLADGSTVPSATFRIRSLTANKVEIGNVRASVAPVAGELGPDPRRALWPAASPPHKQAGHMTAPDQCCSYVRKFLPRRRPHMTQSGHPPAAT
jgi:hypothetical protein